jgi:hypothetical protein
VAVADAADLAADAAAGSVADAGVAVAVVAAADAADTTGIRKHRDKSIGKTYCIG